MSVVERKLFAIECDAPAGCSAELDSGDGVMLHDTTEQARAEAWWADWVTDRGGKDYCPYHRDFAAPRDSAGEGQQ